MCFGHWTSRFCTCQNQLVPVSRVTVRSRTPYCWPLQCNETESWQLLTVAWKVWFRKKNAQTYVLFLYEVATSALKIHG